MDQVDYFLFLAIGVMAISFTMSYLRSVVDFFRAINRE